jgi:hypothetical protein
MVVRRLPGECRLEALMDTLYPCCAGLDVHKGSAVASVRRVDANGQAAEHVRTFSTTTGQLVLLADWRAGEGVTHVAMGKKKSGREQSCSAQ